MLINMTSTQDKAETVKNILTIRDIMVIPKDEEYRIKNTAIYSWLIFENYFDKWSEVERTFKNVK